MSQSNIMSGGNAMSQSNVIDLVISGNFDKILATNARDIHPKKEVDMNVIREAEGVLTDYVVKKFFTKEDTLYSFLSLICNTFQETINLYCKKKNIKNGDIIFIYKGGNILRIVSKEFWLELPSSTSKQLTDFYQKYFSRSDADFSIYINPTLPNFESVFKEISYISYLTLGIIRKKYLDNPHLYFDIYRYNKDYIAKTLNKLLIKINKVKGINCDYISLGNIRNDKADFKSQVNYDKIVTGRTQNDREVINVYENKSPFVNKMREYVDIDRNGYHSIFALIRTKVKFNVWNGEEINKMWGELIDVTVIHKDYYGSEDFFRNISSYITKYDIVYSSMEKLTFYSYSLRYLVIDLEDILFYNEKFVWINNKYQKRVKRLMYLYFVDIFINEKRKNHRIAIYENLQNYLDGNNKIIKDDRYAIYNIVDYIERIKNEVSESDMRLLKEFKKEIHVNIDFILNTLDNIKSYCSTNGKISMNSLYTTSDNILK